MRSRISTFSKSTLLLMSLGMIAGLVSCSSSSHSTPPPPPPTVAITATSGSGQSATVATAFKSPLVATVTTNGAPTSGLTVTFAAPSSGASGSFAGGVTTATTDSNGKATSPVFTANSTSGSYTVTASVSGATTAASFSLTNSAPGVAISVVSGSGQVATAGAPFLAPLIAKVTTNGTATSGVTVTFSAPSSGASGTFAGGATTATTDSNGIATSAAFTANSTSGAYAVTANVTGASSPASFSLTNASSTLADGNYVFSVKGKDSANGTYFYAGVFTVLSGAITKGEQDFSDDSARIFAEAISSGTIIPNPDGTLLITLTFTDSYINGGAGTVSFDASAVSSSKALLIEYDLWATGSGELDLQATSISTPSGGYAFNSQGLDAFGQVFSFGGVINVDGSGTISGSGSVYDVNDSCASKAGTTCTPGIFSSPFVTSTVQVPDTFGYTFFLLNSNCTTGSFDPGMCTTGAGISAGLELDGYIIDANHIVLIENWQNDSLTGTTGGLALGQGTSTGGFSASSVSGSTYVISSAGDDPNGTLQTAGVLTFNSGGTLGGNLSFNDGVNQSAQGGETLSGGTYTVDATGRVTVSGATTTSTPAFTYNLELYLTGDGHAVLISMDATAAAPDVLGGMAWQQTANSLTPASLSGSYAVNLVQLPAAPEQDAVGAFFADGATSLTGFLDVNPGTFTAGSLISDSAFSDTFGVTATNGIFGVTGTGSSAKTYTAYLVDNTQGVVIENDNTQLTLGYFALQ